MKMYLFFLFLFSANIAFAQWEKVDSLANDPISLDTSFLNNGQKSMAKVAGKFRMTTNLMQSQDTFTVVKVFPTKVMLAKTAQSELEQYRKELANLHVQIMWLNRRIAEWRDIINNYIKQP